jgi:penicillin amidase
VVTANQRMTADSFPYKVGFEWSEPYRANRITEVLAKAAHDGHKLTREDMEQLQGDVVSMPARELLALLSAAAKDSNDAATQLLLHWNAAVDRDSAAAALYELWLLEVEHQMLHRLAPENAWKVLQNRLPLPVILRHLQNPTPETFGAQPQTARNQLLLDALNTATAKMKSLQGNDSAAWAWGRLHTVTFHHPLELLEGAKPLLDVGPLPRPGDNYTVNSGGYNAEHFDQVSGPSYREILDVGNWDDSVVANVPGESGEPGSAHYSDLLPYWDQTRYFPMLYSESAVEKEAKNRLTLEPAGNP